MAYLRRALTGLMLLAVTLALLAWAGGMIRDAVAIRLAPAEPGGSARETVYPVRTLRVVSGSETPVIETFGEILAGRAVDLRAGAAGRIAWLAPQVREGGQVESGAALVRIDPADAEAARDSAAADLREAEADLAEARTSVPLAEADLEVAREQAVLRAAALDRQRDLDGRGVGSAAAVETAAIADAQARAQVVTRRQALAQAEARAARSAEAVARARLALARAERRVGDTLVTAPFAGTLAEVSAVPGARVAESESLARLVDPARLDVVARLSAGQYARLLGPEGRLRGAMVSVHLPAGDADLEASGRIDRDAARVGTGGVGRDVFATLGPAGGFKPGDIVTVRIAEPPLDQVARLPARAVGGDGTVLVVGEEDRLVSERVRVVRRQGDAVLVRAGPLEGAELVAHQRPELGAGIRVRRIDGGAAAAGLSPPAGAPAGDAQGG